MKLALTNIIQVRLWEELVRRNTYTAVPHIIMCFVSYGILLSMHKSHWVYYLPYASVFLGCFLRMGISKKMRPGIVPSNIYQGIFFFGSFLMGAGWATLFVSAHQFFGDYDGRTIYTFLLMAGFISGAVTTFAAFPKGYYYFMLPMSINTAVYAFYSGLADPYAVTFCVGFYTLFHINQIHMSHRYFVSYIENEIAITWERDKLKSFINAVPGFVGRIDKDLTYQEINDYSTESFKTNDVLGEFIGKYHGDSEFTTYVKDFMNGNTPAAVKELPITFGQRTSMFVVNIQRILPPLQGAVIVGVPMDELVEARERVKIQEAQAVYTAKLASLGEVAAGIAHEINNPLAIIMGSTDMMIKQLDRPTLDLPKIKTYAEKINVTITRISNIIKSLKGLARNADKDPFQPCKFQTILEPCVEVTRQRFLEHAVAFEVIGNDQDKHLFGRELQLSQVMMNLINNAFDAAVEGPTPKWVRLNVSYVEDFIDIRVQDSGHGIPRELRRKIMEPFFTTKPINKGTGLGLSISKSIIEEHGGHLKLDEESPHTTFVVRVRKAPTEIC